MCFWGVERWKKSMTSKENTCMHYNDATIVKTPLLSTKSSSSWYYWNNFCNKKPWLHQVLMVMSKKSNRYVIQYCSTYARKEIFDSTAATSSASYTLHQLSLKKLERRGNYWLPILSSIQSTDLLNLNKKMIMASGIVENVNGVISVPKNTVILF